MCDHVCVCVIMCVYVSSVDASACVARYFNGTTSKSVTDSLCFLSLFPSLLYLSLSISPIPLCSALASLRLKHVQRSRSTGV